MRRGCISLGNIKCDKCHCTIPYPERYLFLEETKGVNQTLCVECCEKMGLVKSRTGKGEESLFDLSNE